MRSEAHARDEDAWPSTSPSARRVTRSSRIERDPFTQHAVTRRGELLEQRPGLLGVGDAGDVSPVEALERTPSACSPTVTSTSIPSCGRVLADLAVVARGSSGPSSVMSPSTATRRPRAAAPGRSRAARIDIGLAL